MLLNNKKLGVAKFREKQTLLKMEPNIYHLVILNSCFFSQIGHNKAWITLTVITNLLKYCYIKFNAIVGFHLKSLKFKLKTIDSTEILLSRCITAPGN